MKNTDKQKKARKFKYSKKIWVQKSKKIRIFKKNLDFFFAQKMRHFVMIFKHCVVV